MKGRERLLRHIVLHVVQHCPHCHGSFAEEDVRLAGQEGENWFFSLHCRSCQRLSLIGFVMPAEAEVFPDQEVGEALPLPLSADDVLEMRLFLENVRDFRSLLGE